MSFTSYLGGNQTPGGIPTSSKQLSPAETVAATRAANSAAQAAGLPTGAGVPGMPSGTSSQSADDIIAQLQTNLSPAQIEALKTHTVAFQLSFANTEDPRPGHYWEPRKYVTLHLSFADAVQYLYAHPNNRPQIVDLQKRLYEAGYYADDFYKAGQTPSWGTILDDSATINAFAAAMLDATKTGTDLETVLKQHGDARRNIINGWLQQAGQGGLIDNPTQVLTQSSVDTINASTDKIAQQVFGMKATAAQKAAMVDLVHSGELAPQIAAANANQQNRVGAAQASAGLSGTPLAPQGGTGGGLTFPVAGPHRIGDGLGAGRDGHTHAGVDIPAATNTPVVAAMAGKVIRVATGGKAGNRVYVLGTDGRTYAYFHLSDHDFGVVQNGAQVAAGQLIGRVGATGDATGPHLHFEIQNADGGVAGAGDAVYSQKVDPMPELLAAEQPSARDPGSYQGAAPAGGDELTAFMAAIRDTESSNNYDWSLTSSAGAHGAYQFMDGTWRSAAARAGVDPNDHSPAAQDAAAKALMSYYFNKYHDWRLVAIAWNGGEGTADKAAKGGDVSGISDGLKGGVNKYADIVLSKLGRDGGTTTGGPGDANVQIVDAFDAQSAIEAQLRKDDPALAGAHDIALQYQQFQQMFQPVSGA